MNVSKKYLCCAVVVLSASGVCVRTYAQFRGSASEKPAEKAMLAEGQEVAAAAKQGGHEICRCVGESDSAAVAKIEQALSGPLHSTGLDFVDTPLADVVTAMQDDYGIPIQLDTTALEEIGVGTDEKVTANLHNITLRSALRLMLKRLQLNYAIQDEVLIITSPQEAEAQLKTCVYNVGSLAGEHDAQMGSIIDTIVSCIATDTWAKNGGGQAEVRAIKPGLLVVSQTRAAHEEIRSLLTTLLKMQDSHATAVATTTANVPRDGREVITRSYTLQLNPTDDIATMRNQVHELVTASLPEETWSGRLASGEGVMLSVFHDRIVVRQTPAVQEKVQKILTDSGVATPAAAVGSMPGAASGFGGTNGRGGGFFRPADNSFGAVSDVGSGPGFEAPSAGADGNPGAAAAPGFGGEPAGIAPEPARAD